AGQADGNGEEATETAAEEGEAPGILFQRRENLNTDIYMIQPDGSGLIQLTDDPAEDYEPRWRSRYQSRRRWA
ncbi:MAG TPA: hypothetical protein VFZ12_00140, partial [Dehalococcoidia bacterium]|nr:hypothetical protein [Dehalococcoidia bacterium]